MAEHRLERTREAYQIVNCKVCVKPTCEADGVCGGCKYRASLQGKLEAAEGRLQTLSALIHRRKTRPEFGATEDGEGWVGEVSGAPPAPPRQSALQHAALAFLQAAERYRIHSELSSESDPIDITLSMLLAREALREALHAAPAPPQWHPIETAPKGRKVLVSWLNALGKRRTTFAVYFEADTLDMEDEYDGGTNEEGRNAEAGWFEDREAGEPSYYELKEPLTHWMPLPKPPTSLPAPPAPQEPT